MTLRTSKIPSSAARMLLAASFAWVATAALAEPGAHWQTADPVAAGWSAPALEAVRARATATGFTALMIVEGDRVIAAWGDPARKVRMNSVRKSLLSALYGIAVAEARIDLDETLGNLGIDDTPPGLSETEKTAVIRDLLTARSGIYHPAAYETGDMKARRPARGSHVPGSFWFYNNWDFNALGTIYRQKTGEDVFRSFSTRIAARIDMEDFRAGDGVWVSEASSLHPAYTFRMSARDAARFGLMMGLGGRWNGSEVVPSAWVAASTRTSVTTDHGPLGYGYMWWTLPATIGGGGFMALGFGGQAIAVLPERHLVIVRTIDQADHPAGARTSSFVDLLKDIVAARSGGPG